MGFWGIGEMKTETYIEFFFPGSFFAESESKLVVDRNIPDSLPEGCFAFSFYTITSTEVDGEILRGSRKNKSVRYYPDAMLLTIEDIEKIPDTKVLQLNMKNNNWNPIIKTCVGNFQPFSSGDVIYKTK